MPNFNDQVIELTLTNTTPDVGVIKSFVPVHMHRHEELLNLQLDSHPQYLTEDRGLNLIDFVLNERGITQQEPIEAGEINDGQNVGGGIGVFKQKLGEILQFLTFIESDNIAFRKIGNNIIAEYLPTIEILRVEVGFATKQLLEVGELLDATQEDWHLLEFHAFLNRQPQAFTLTAPGGIDFPIQRPPFAIPEDLTGPYQIVEHDEEIEYIFSFALDKFTLGAPGTKSFLISASAGTKSDEDIVTFTWAYKLYWGTAVPTTVTEGFVKALSGSKVSTNSNVTFDVSASPTEKIFFALPTTYAEPTFTVDGFNGGFFKAASALSITNDFGITITYDVWESDEVNLGDVTIEVS